MLPLLKFPVQGNDGGNSDFRLSAQSDALRARSAIRLKAQSLGALTKKFRVGLLEPVRKTLTPVPEDTELDLCDYIAMDLAFCYNRAN